MPRGSLDGVRQDDVAQVGRGERRRLEDDECLAEDLGDPLPRHGVHVEEVVRQLVSGSHGGGAGIRRVGERVVGIARAAPGLGPLGGKRQLEEARHARAAPDGENARPLVGVGVGAGARAAGAPAGVGVARAAAGVGVGAARGVGVARATARSVGIGAARSVGVARGAARSVGIGAARRRGGRPTARGRRARASLDPGADPIAVAANARRAEEHPGSAAHHGHAHRARASGLGVRGLGRVRGDPREAQGVLDADLVRARARDEDRPGVQARAHALLAALAPLGRGRVPPRGVGRRRRLSALEVLVHLAEVGARAAAGEVRGRAVVVELDGGGVVRRGKGGPASLDSRELPQLERVEVGGIGRVVVGRGHELEVDRQPVARTRDPAAVGREHLERRDERVRAQARVAREDELLHLRADLVARVALGPVVDRVGRLRVGPVALEERVVDPVSRRGERDPRAGLLAVVEVEIAREVKLGAEAGVDVRTRGRAEVGHLLDRAEVDERLELAQPIVVQVRDVDRIRAREVGDPVVLAGVARARGIAPVAGLDVLPEPLEALLEDARLGVHVERSRRVGERLVVVAERLQALLDPEDAVRERRRRRAVSRLRGVGVLVRVVRRVGVLAGARGRVGLRLQVVVVGVRDDRLVEPVRVADRELEADLRIDRDDGRERAVAADSHEERERGDRRRLGPGGRAVGRARRRAGVRAVGRARRRAGVRAVGRAGVRAVGRAGVRAGRRAGVRARRRAGVRSRGRGVGRHDGPVRSEHAVGDGPLERRERRRVLVGLRVGERDVLGVVDLDRGLHGRVVAGDVAPERDRLTVLEQPERRVGRLRSGARPAQVRHARVSEVEDGGVSRLVGGRDDPDGHLQRRLLGIVGRVGPARDDLVRRPLRGEREEAASPRP